MFRVKICGVTNVEDAIAAVDAGADAIGLNFYDKSPRFLRVEAARNIVDYLRRPATVVGVFVNSQVSDILSILREARVDVIQLHGDEPAEFLAQFPTRFYQDSGFRQTTLTLDCKIIRVRRFDDRGVAGIASDLEECAGAGRMPMAVMVDALTPGRYGGTGETVSWVGLADHKRWLGDTPLILAGGLTPDNVAEAIRIVRPAAVDVASGVESALGKKDPAKVRDFIAAARAAFDSISE
jgi:phosphoribosylanthranilate isomerase